MLFNAVVNQTTAVFLDATRSVRQTLSQTNANGNAKRASMFLKLHSPHSYPSYDLR
jgi:hypothetical protein